MNIDHFNHLEMLVFICPEENWDRDYLSINKNITVNIVKILDPKHDRWNLVDISYQSSLITYDEAIRNSDVCPSLYGIFRNKKISYDVIKIFAGINVCYWEELSSNENLTSRFISENISLPWNFCELSGNKAVNWALIKKLPDKPWDWGRLSVNESMTESIIKNNIKEKWDWKFLSIRDDFSTDFLRQYMEFLTMDCLSKSKNLTWDIVENNLHKDWGWHHLSKNRFLNINIISKYEEKPWDEYELSENLYISFKEILNDLNSVEPCVNWDLGCLSLREDLKIEYVSENKHLRWNWNYISGNKAIKWNDVKNNMDLPWCFDSLSSNQNITFSIVFNNFHLPWDHEGLSANPNLTWEILMQNKEKIKWNFSIISHNDFNYDEKIKLFHMIKKLWESYKLKKVLKQSLNKNL